jgi:hypothetical protein
MQLYHYSMSQSSEFCRRNRLNYFSTCCCLFRYRLSPETFGYTLVWHGYSASCALYLGEKVTSAYAYLNIFTWDAARISRSLIFGCQVWNATLTIVLGYGLDDRGSGVRFPAGAGNFSLNHRVQNGSEPHRASYPMGSTGSFLGGKAIEGVKLTTRLHLVPRSKNAWSYISTPQYAFMV